MSMVGKRTNGEMLAGERANGEMLAKESTNGETTAGERTDEETLAGEMMNEKIWEQARSLSPACTDRKRAMEAIREEIAGKRLRYVPSYRELFMIELQYISPLFWMLQGILVTGLLFIFYVMPYPEHDFADNMRWISIAAAWMGVVTCSDLGRHISKGMAELEQSCYFNLPQMWTMRMILTGIVDILLLTFCSGRIAETVSAPFAQVCVYVLVPFVLSNACCLLLFSFMRGGRGRYGQLTMAFSAGIMAMIPSATPSWYQVEFLGIWIGVLLAGVMLFLWQIRILYGKMSRGEILCWN